jgi:hypothetical protein
MISVDQAASLKSRHPPNAVNTGRSAAALRAECEISMQPAGASRHQLLAAGNGLPVGVALGNVRVVPRRVGAVVPSLGGRRLAVVGVAAVGRIVPVKPATVKSIPVKPAKSGVESAAVEPTKSATPAKSAAMEPATAVKGSAATAVKASATTAAMEPATTTAMEPATAAAMETSASASAPAPAPAMSVSEIWGAQCGNAQQSSCRGSQSPSHPGAVSLFV